MSGGDVDVHAPLAGDAVVATASGFDGERYFAVGAPARSPVGCFGVKHPVTVAPIEVEALLEERFAVEVGGDGLLFFERG